MSEWISRVCAKQKTFYVPPLSHSKSSQKSNKAINRTNSYKNVLVVVVLCIIYPNTPLTMSIFFSVLAGKKIQNVHFGILRHRHILLFTRRERIPHLMDLLSKRFAIGFFPPMTEYICKNITVGSNVDLDIQKVENKQSI